ncbi:MAG TPA: hypothetical protein VF656_19020 [Pyrinomonadaceae bacterium]|jgi:hypothetical protein
MQRRLLILALLFAACTLLSGCFEFRQEFWINPDGSGRILMDIGIQQMGNSNEGAQKRVPSEFEKNMREANERLSKDPNIKSVKMSQEMRDRMLHTVFDIECKDLTKFSESMRESARKSVPSGKVGQAQESMAPVIEKLPNGDYAFRMSMERGQKKPASNHQMNRIAEQMVERIFAGRFWIVTLHAPKVTETNGQLNATSNLVEWKIPMTQIAAEKLPYKELNARVQMPSIVSPQRWMPELTSASSGWGTRHYAVLGIAAMLLLAAGLLLFKSLRKAP